MTVRDSRIVRTGDARLSPFRMCRYTIDVKFACVGNFETEALT
jgi:hypothetical protein